MENTKALFSSELVEGVADTSFSYFLVFSLRGIVPFYDVVGTKWPNRFYSYFKGN